VAGIAELRRPMASEQATIQAETIIDAGELAAKLRLPKSWVMEQTRSRAVDPIPCLRFGRYVRFRWGSRELNGWLERRANQQLERTIR
jgi:hypothetical protein